MSADVPFQFAEATKVTETKPAQAGEHAVGDTTTLPKPENKPVNLGLFDDSVKDPKFGADEADAVVQTSVAIATAADDIEDAFEEVKRVAVALEALRQVPISHLNPSVIAMFETHLPQGSKRVARESAMTPVNMRKVALESGQGFFASIGEAIRKIWEWIKARFDDFLNLFRSREAKQAEVEKKLDTFLKEVEKDLDKALIELTAEEAIKKQTGTFIKVDGEVKMVYQPTEATHIFFKGFTKEGIMASIKEMEAGLDKSAAGVEKMRKFVENTTRIENRLGTEKASSLGEKATQRLMASLPADSEKGTCSIHAWPKQFIIKAEGEGIAFGSVEVPAEGEQQPLLLTVNEFRAVNQAVKHLSAKVEAFVINSKKVIEGLERNAATALARMEKLGEAEPSVKEQTEELRKELPIMTRMFAHILQGAVYHASLVEGAWFSACMASVTKNMGAPATESAKPKVEPQGFRFA